MGREAIRFLDLFKTIQEAPNMEEVLNRHGGQCFYIPIFKKYSSGLLQKDKKLCESLLQEVENNSCNNMVLKYGVSIGTVYKWVRIAKKQLTM